MLILVPVLMLIPTLPVSTAPDGHTTTPVATAINGPTVYKHCICYFFMSTILLFRPTITMTADDDSFSSYDSVSTTELTVGTTNTGTSVDMPSSSFAFRMGRASCSSNVSACDSNIGRTDTTTNTFRVHCFSFNRDESILLRRLLQLLTVLQYTFFLFLMSSIGRAIPINNYWIKFDRGGLCYCICFHPVPASSPFTDPSTM